MTDKNALAQELEADRGANRELDARVAVALYDDSGHADARDNTTARLPSASDGCAAGTYWISSFSGLSLRNAPDYTSDRTLKRLALAVLRTPAPAPVGGEPVAWMYDHPDGSRILLREKLHRDGVLHSKTGWTETPLVPLQAQPAPQGDVVEAVARIIAPSSWSVMDAEKAQMLRKYKGQNIGYDPVQFQHKESMAKAREILTALASLPSAEAHRAGEYDASAAVQAFARHREQARADAEREIVAWLRKLNPHASPSWIAHQIESGAYRHG